MKKQPTRQGFRRTARFVFLGGFTFFAGCASYGNRGLYAEPHYAGDYRPQQNARPFEGSEPAQFNPDAPSLSK